MLKKFAYNEHPVITSSFFCIFLFVVSRTQCTGIVLFCYASFIRQNYVLGGDYSFIHSNIFKTQCNGNSDSDSDSDFNSNGYIVLCRSFHTGSDSNLDSYLDGFPNGYCTHFRDRSPSRGQISIPILLYFNQGIRV